LTPDGPQKRSVTRPDARRKTPLLWRTEYEPSPRESVLRGAGNPLGALGPWGESPNHFGVAQLFQREPDS
jgi:hypothetical protein